MPSATKTPKPSAAAQMAVMRALTQQAAAELLGIRPSNLRDQFGPEVRNEDGAYDAVRLVAEAVRRASPTSMDERALKRAEIVARTARDRAQADRLELVILRERGDLVKRSDVVATISSILSAYTEHFMGFADKIAPNLPADVRSDVAEMIRADTARTLTGLSEELQRKVVSTESDDDGDDR